MSKYLGPIHFWLYGKITGQNELTKEIWELCGDQIPDLKETVTSKYGNFSGLPLEESVDEGNIHGWLQERVSEAEYRLAATLKLIQEKSPKMQDKVEELCYQKGRSLASQEEEEGPYAVYKIMNDRLLDGMPCDHAYTLVSRTEEQVVFERNICTHREYWEDVPGGTGLYYKCRDRFLEGIAEEKGLKYEKITDTGVSVKKGA